jgi:hypothetical protein
MVRTLDATHPQFSFRGYPHVLNAEPPAVAANLDFITLSELDKALSEH